MEYFEIEKSIKEKDWSMTNLHSHAHYELYFLIEGVRSLFIQDKLYKMCAPSFIVIPPYSMHKTEGLKFKRININISVNGLNKYELNVLNGLSGKVYSNVKNFNEIYSLLKEADAEYNAENSFEAAREIVGYIIYKLDLSLKNEQRATANALTDNASSIALKTVEYINENYADKITLSNLSEKFFASKVTLCKYFKTAMNCTIAQYLLRIRLNQVKKYLSDTNKSIEEISFLCGFSSAAYMGIAFKSATGLSPLAYRKNQNIKRS